MNALTLALYLENNFKTIEEKRMFLDSLLEMGKVKESVYNAVNKRLK